MTATIHTQSLTLSQQCILARLRELGCLQFDEQLHGGPLKCRLNPLIAAPTGAGKSFLVKQIAETFKAHYLSLTYGDWIVQGASKEHGDPTVKCILQALMQYPRVLLHIDELDKIGNPASGGGSGWDRSIRTDLWKVLDYQLPPIETLGEHAQLPEYRNFMSVEKIQRRLWIVGSGTWQNLFTTQEPGFMGYGKQSGETSIDMGERIVKSEIIPQELTARFYGEIFIMEYPKSDEEIQELLQSFGLSESARELGIPIDLSALKQVIKFQGMRAFETLKTRLNIASLRRTPLFSHNSDSMRERDENNYCTVMLELLEAKIARLQSMGVDLDAAN
jgi:hypothetical protein